MGPLQAMDRSIAAAPIGNAPLSGRAPASDAAALRLRLAALAFVVVLVLAALLAPLLRGGSGEAKRSTGEPAGASLPATARAQVSALLGAEDRAFAVTGTAGGEAGGETGGEFHARNAPQRLSASFTRAGVKIAAPGIDASLSLKAFGADGSLQAVAAASAAAHANRASYARGDGLTEWYANGPAGLEQGFTVARAPAHATTSRLTLSLALDSSARRSLAADGESLTLRSAGHELHYGGLVATDASGRALPSRLALEAGRLLIHVNAAGARYPLTIDPLLEVGGKLTAPSEGEGREEGEGLFGTSVALSADGETLLVGAPHDTNENDGAAWVFIRSGEAWVQQGAKLTGVGGVPKSEEEEQCAEESPEEAGECAFGASVALSADGNTALIGEPSATARAGSAWVFRRTGTGPAAEWTKAMTLAGEGVPGEGRFGKSVALSADGATALIGDPSASSQRGGAWVFALSSTSSTLQGKLTDAEAAHFDHAGRSVALSSDGSTALIGVPGANEYTGAALVFTRAGESWSRNTGELTGEGEVGQGRFGKSVALSADGATALVGAPSDDENIGAAWGFARESGSFALQSGKLTGATAVGGHLGTSVALSGDGSVALIGVPREGTGGEVAQYAHSGATWTKRKEQLAGAGEGGRGWLGAAVALASEGNVAAVGAPHDNARVGAAWGFAVTTPPVPVVNAVKPGFGPAGTIVRIEGTGFSEASTVSFGSVPVAASEFVVESALAIEAIAPPGTEKVDVTVRTSGGLSAVNSDDTFRYTTGGGTGNKKSGGGGTTTGGEELTTTTTTTTTGGTTIGAKAAGGVLGTTSSAAAACQVTLRSKRLAVTSYRTVALRLMRAGAGAGACSGKLTLNFNLRPKGKRAKLEAIGTASYSISEGTSKVFKIILNKAGRKLFRAHRGKLNVSLAIVRAVPAPRLARSASVRLTWKKTHKAVTLTK
jgi:hypothetical protein